MSRSVFPILLALLVLVACGNSGDTANTDSTSGSESDMDPNAQRMIGLAPPGGAVDGQTCALSTVYFAFDSNTLDEPSRQAISEAVDCIRARRAPANLHITGATDPEGTEEYNLALGERRAQAVQSYLTNLGVDAERVSVSSVGEEMATGEDEAGFAQDRNAQTRID